MTIRREERFWVKCDECGENCRSHSRSGELEAERRAESLGWLSAKLHYVGIYGHLCPACAKKPPEWWPTKESP